MNINDYIAAEVAKNAAGEYEAIEGYMRLLTVQGMSKELTDDNKRRNESRREIG